MNERIATVEKVLDVHSKEEPIILTARSGQVARGVSGKLHCASCLAQDRSLKHSFLFGWFLVCFVFLSTKKDHKTWQAQSTFSSVFLHLNSLINF